MSAGYRFISAARKAPEIHGLRRNPSHVLLVLATHADGKGICYPSVALIARECGLSPRSKSMVPQALRELETAGLIETSARGKGQSVQRRLLLDHLIDGAPKVDQANEALHAELDALAAQDHTPANALTWDMETAA